MKIEDSAESETSKVTVKYDTDGDKFEVGVKEIASDYRSMSGGTTSFSVTCNYEQLVKLRNVIDTIFSMRGKMNAAG